MKYLFCEGERRTLESVLEDESDVLHRLTYTTALTTLKTYVVEMQETILQTVAKHVDVSPAACQFEGDLTLGGFNMCIPVSIRAGDCHVKKVMFRVPLHHKVGETLYPGNVDEKLRTEAAIYILIREKWPDFPITELLGFGLTNGDAYSSKGVKRFKTTFRLGYLITTFVESGRLLSDVFEDEDTLERRTNLYRDLAQVMIRLASVRSSRIGSLTLCETGEIAVTNRPLFLRLQWLEGQGIDTNIGRGTTFESTVDYWNALLDCHSNRLKTQPNSIIDEEDGRRQMAALQILKENLETAVLTRKGNFSAHLSLTDLTTTNMFVDSQWRITKLVDLEWACFWPIEMIHPPMWLIGVDIARLARHHSDFEDERAKFMCIFKEVELDLRMTEGLGEAMERSWQNGSCWTGIALGNTTSAYDLICDQLLPRFYKGIDFEQTYMEESKKWTENSEDFIQKKLDDLARYKERAASLAHEE